MPSAVEKRFIEQAPTFTAALAKMYGDRPPRLTDTPAFEVPAVDIVNCSAVTRGEAESIQAQYRSIYGVAHFRVTSEPSTAIAAHPLTILSDQLAGWIDCRYPMHHPLDDEKPSFSHDYQPDGTVKIYSAPKKGVARSERELLAHQDGLGSCGDVECVGLYMDRPGRSGGETYFINLALLCAQLGEDDPLAYESLFAPDAITITRISGYRSLKVVSPVCSLYPDGAPQVVYRNAGGEYEVEWKSGNPSLRRARELLQEHTKPFANGSAFVKFNRRGQGCFNNNRLTVHGRRAFENGTLTDRQRLLSRKWYATGPSSRDVKHAPGIRLQPQYASLLPDIFGEDRLRGDWWYDETTQTNVQRN